MHSCTLPFSNLKNSQLSQSFLLWEMLHPADHFCGPLLDLLQQLHDFPVLRTCHLDTVFLLGSHRNCSDLFGCSFGHVWLSGLWMHRAAASPASHPPAATSPPHGAALHLFIPQHVLIMGFAIAQVQHLALGFVEHYEVLAGPPLDLSRSSLFMPSIPSGMSNATLSFRVSKFTID